MSHTAGQVLTAPEAREFLGLAQISSLHGFERRAERVGVNVRLPGRARLYDAENLRIARARVPRRTFRAGRPCPLGADAPHNTAANYSAGCTCEAARDAWRRYTKLRLRPPTGYVPAAPVGDKIRNLRGRGWTVAEIAAAAGVGPNTLFRLTKGRQPRTLRKIDATVTALWESAQGRPSGRGLVDATGTRRRVAAMNRMGWTTQSIAERAGLSTHTLAVLPRQKSVRASTAARVSVVYDELSMVPGPSKIAQLRAVKARKKPPLAWDDDQIDTPAPPLPKPGVVSHEVVFLTRVQAGLFRVDTENGVIYGAAGQPVGGGRDGRIRMVGLDRRLVAVRTARAVWTYAHGEIPSGEHIRHINGDTADNRLVNLVAIRPGQYSRTRRAGHPWTSTEQREDIARLTRAGLSTRVVAERVGVSQRTVMRWLKREKTVTA